MAISEADKLKIYEALAALGVPKSNPPNINADINKGMQVLVNLLNSNSAPGTPKVQYDPNIGYTPTSGAQLSKMMEDFKKREFEVDVTGVPKFKINAYEELKSNEVSWKERLLKTSIQANENFPQPIRNNPSVLVSLIDRIGPSAIGAMDKHYYETHPSERPAADRSQKVTTQTTVKPNNTAAGTTNTPASPAPNQTPPETKQPTTTSGTALSDPETDRAVIVVETALKDIADFLGKTSPGQIGGDFDVQSQKSLQEVLTAVRNVLGVKPVDANDKVYLYTPDIGERLKQEYLKSDKKGLIDGILEPAGGFDAFISSLNTLHSKNKISSEDLSATPFAPRRPAKPPELTDLQKNILSWVSKQSPSMTLFIDSMLTQLSGFGLKDILPKDMLPAGLDQAASLPADVKARYVQLYKDAHKDGRSVVDVHKDIKRGLEAFAQLSLTDPKRQKAFDDFVKEALQAAQKAQGDPPNMDAGAEAFATRMAQRMQNFDRDFPNSGAPTNRFHSGTYYTIDRRQYTFATAGGENINAISAAYATLNAGRLAGGEQPLIFKDTNGKMYMAGVERASGIMTVMEVTPEELAKLNEMIMVGMGGKTELNHAEGSALRDNMMRNSAIYKFAETNYAVTIGDHGRGFIAQVQNAPVLGNLITAQKDHAADLAKRAASLSVDTTTSPVTGREIAPVPPGTKNVHVAGPNFSALTYNERAERGAHLQGLNWNPEVVKDRQGQFRILYQDKSILAEINDSRILLQRGISEGRLSPADIRNAGNRIDDLAYNQQFKSAPYPAEEIEAFKAKYGSTYANGARPMPNVNGDLESEFPNMAMIMRHYPQFKGNLPGFVATMEAGKQNAPVFDLQASFNATGGITAAKAAAPAATNDATQKPTEPAGPKQCVIEFSANADEVGGSVSNCGSRVPIPAMGASSSPRL